MSSLVILMISICFIIKMTKYLLLGVSGEESKVPEMLNNYPIREWIGYIAEEEDSKSYRYMVRSISFTNQGDIISPVSLNRKKVQILHLRTPRFDEIVQHV
jgi:hypothetical protein